MAKSNQLVHLDMNLNQLLKAVLENVTADPAGVAGQVIYNTSTNESKWYTGTSWEAIAKASSVASNTSGIATLTTAVNGKEDASNKVTTLRDSATATDTAYASELAVRTAIDAITTAVSAGVNIKGGLDASANPDYPAAVTGDMYRVTVAGKIGGASGEVVQVGDSIICFADAAAGDQATVGSSWLIDQGNVDAASDTILGIVRLATTAEVTAGSGSGLPSVTQVNAMIAGGGASQRVSITLTSGSTSYTVNHALNGNVVVQVFNSVTGDYVVTDVSRVDANNVTVAVNVALTQDHIAVCVLAG